MPVRTPAAVHGNGKGEAQPLNVRSEMHIKRCLRCGRTLLVRCLRAHSCVAGAGRSRIASKNLNFFFSGSRSDEGCAMAADLADAKAGDILYSQYEGEHQVHF